MIKVEGGHLWLMMSADLSHAQWETRLCQITGTNFTMSDSFIKLQNKPVQETPNLIVLGGSLFLHHLTIQAAVCKLTQLLMQCCREHSLDNNDTIISVFTFTSIFWRTVPGNYLWWLCVVYHLCAVCLKFVFQSTTTVRSTERCEIITCPSAGAHTVLSLGFFFIQPMHRPSPLGFFLLLIVVAWYSRSTTFLLAQIMPDIVLYDALFTYFGDKISLSTRLLHFFCSL